MAEEFGPFDDVTLEEILTSYENGQKKQASVMINYYGTEFWYDLAKKMSHEAVGQPDYHIFVLITISYNVHFPNPNQAA